MICLIEWCNSNQGFLSAVLSILTVSVSLIVMWCSNRNAATILKKQQKQEKEIELRQEDMQRRQIKVDTYPYRLECWKTLYRIKDVVEILKLGFEEKFSMKKIIKIYMIFTKGFLKQETVCLILLFFH
ncbi:MAG: hypothetical protein K5768_01345 [Firmicutes bacterium]|nr:hypothetical protein [Bacillota bacterium]